MGRWRSFRRALGKFCCIPCDEEKIEDTEIDGVKKVEMMANGSFEGKCRVCGDTNCIAYQRNLRLNSFIDTIPAAKVDRSDSGNIMTENKLENSELKKPGDSSLEQPCSSTSSQNDGAGGNMNETGSPDTADASSVVENVEEKTKDNAMTACATMMELDGKLACANEDGPETPQAHAGMQDCKTCLTGESEHAASPTEGVPTLTEPRNVQQREQIDVCEMSPSDSCSNKSQQLFPPYAGYNCDNGTVDGEIITQGRQTSLRTVEANGRRQDGCVARRHKLVARRRGKVGTMKRFSALGNPVLNLPEGVMISATDAECGSSGPEEKPDNGEDELYSMLKEIDRQVTAFCNGDNKEELVDTAAADETSDQAGQSDNDK